MIKSIKSKILILPIAIKSALTGNLFLLHFFLLFGCRFACAFAFSFIFALSIHPSYAVEECPWYANPSVKVRFAGSFENDLAIVRVNEVFMLQGAVSGFPGDRFFDLQWQFGDGQKKSNDLTVSFSYANPGDYQIRLYARDNCGFADTGKLTIRVLPYDVVSSLAINSSELYIHRPVQLFQLGPTNSTTVVVNWGDRTQQQTLNLTPGESVYASHVYRKPGDYRIKAWLMNAASASMKKFDVQVFDQPVAPQVEVLKLQRLTTKPLSFRQKVSVPVAIQDDGSSVSVSVDWGDGSSPTIVGRDFFFGSQFRRVYKIGSEIFFVGKRKLKHRYALPGTYNIIVRAEDRDQLTSEKSFQVTLVE